MKTLAEKLRFDHAFEATLGHEGCITRIYSGDEGTFGILSLNTFICRTLEPPWRNNQSDISCIPPGLYKANPYSSHHFGNVYHVEDVKGRFGILIHTGNFGGDVTLGFKTHTHGCILLAKYSGTLQGQHAILYSRPTLRRFLEIAQNQELSILIREAYTC